jgi:SAM-dependent methyltransferase
MTFKDYFSQHANAYARHRPHYPPALFEYLASLVAEHETAWDCGTGNGQAALGLTPYFERVIATDASAEQISNAFRHEKITYRVAQAGKADHLDAGLDPASVDLITVAQALHWFDIDSFFEEAKRTLKPGGVLAVWAYGLCRITPRLDPIVDRFYFETVGPYWPPERRLVDDGYRSLVFPFDEMQAPDFVIELPWSRADLLGYLRTWSPTRRFIEVHGRDPVDDVEGEIAEAWGDTGELGEAGEAGEEKPVRWPLHMRVGRGPR